MDKNVDMDRDTDTDTTHDIFETEDMDMGTRQ